MSEATTHTEVVVESTMKSRFITSLAQFVSLFVKLLFLLLVVRVFEIVVNGFAHGFPAKPLAIMPMLLLSEIKLAALLFLLLGIIIIPVGICSLRIARIIFITLGIIIMISYFALVYYFYSTLVLLGADLFGYSLKDIRETVHASGGLNMLSISLMMAIAAATYFLLTRKFNVNKERKPGFPVAAAIVTALIFSWIILSTAYDKEYDKNLSKNKLAYFYAASWDHIFSSQSETDIYADSYIGDYGNPGDDSISVINYVDEKEYPFLHADKNPDVLSAFFQKGSSKPNIVVIIVEGLGRAFANENAYLGNFTPFLDSLTQHSLYWENCLSGSGRTFAVMPTLLGSLPFGKNGFNELKENMPSHLSLPSLLKRNGYNTGFFYCGDASFDNMDLFAQRQGMTVTDRKSFPDGYELLPGNSSGFSWGYGDKELFRYFFQSHPVNSMQPTMQVLMTVATHSPFLVNEQPYYEKKFEDRLNVLKLKEEEKEERRRYHQQFESILYADDALQSFFNEYSKRADFANTIFIVTGDHRMPEIPMISKIDRYHVPLLIFSPLLKRTARIPSVTTHFDLVPSLLSFLSNNYAIQIPSQSHWLSKGLDTAHVFRNIHSSGLMQTKNDLIDFVMGKYHLNGEDLYELTSTLGEAKIENETILQNMRSALQHFRQKNDAFVTGAKLLPDSTFRNYHP